MEVYYSAPNAINIFTDASTTIGSGETFGFVSPGFIAVQNGLILASDYRVLNGETSQFAELYAIMMGLTFMNTDVWTKRYTGRAKEVDSTIYNLFSDSMYSLQCLRDLLPQWVDITNRAVNRNNHPNYNYDGSPPDLLKRKESYSTKKKKKHQHTTDKPDEARFKYVANQEVLMHCMGLIVYTQKELNTYHIKAHLEETNKGHIAKAKEAFEKFNNGITASEEEIKDMIHWNNQIDNTTRMHLKTILDYNRNLPNQVCWPVRYYPNEQHQMLYKRFIR